MIGKLLDRLEPLDLWLRGRAPFGLTRRHARDSYSQEGEDILFERLYQGPQPGSFIDIGAHHPLRFSNTYRLYRRGWRGLNIDALPGSMRLFKLARPHDINVECAVARQDGELIYHQFDEPALNTLDAAQARHQAAHTPYRLVAQTAVPARSLRSLLAEHWAPGRRIDLMNVDIEGYELPVLSSNDWRRHRPRWILAETLRCAFAKVPSTPLARYLARQGYRPVARTLNTVFFEDGRA